jgi:uncharacterized protein YukE
MRQIFMGTKIQLTPGELQAQAKEMNTLKEEYSSLFSGVTSELRTINSNWSPNLANNFCGKITSAQKTFEQVTDMLGNGATVADNCAVSFASVDSELSKMFNGGLAEGAKSFGDAFIERLKEAPNDIKSAADFFDWIEEMYNQFPDITKDAIKKACPGNLKEAYELTSDLFQGDLSVENIYSVLEYVTDNSTTCKVIVSTCKWFTENYDKYSQMSADLEDAVTNEILEGDLLGAVTEIAEGFIDGVGGGVIEVGGNLIGNYVDGIAGKLPFVDDFINENLNGKTFGSYISDGASYISDGLDWVTDGLAYGIDFVSDSAIGGIQAVGSWIGDLF